MLKFMLATIAAALLACGGTTMTPVAPQQTDVAGTPTFSGTVFSGTVRLYAGRAFLLLREVRAPEDHERVETHGDHEIHLGDYGASEYSAAVVEDVGEVPTEHEVTVVQVCDGQPHRAFRALELSVGDLNVRDGAAGGSALFERPALGFEACD